MATTIEKLIQFIINHIEQSRNEKNNKYYVVDDVISAINQLEIIRTFYHRSEDNKKKILNLIKNIFEKDGVTNPATPHIMHKEIGQLLINISIMIHGK